MEQISNIFCRSVNHVLDMMSKNVQDTLDQDYDIASFKEMWNRTDMVCTNEIETKILSYDSNQTEQEQPHVKERFCYYYQPEHIPLMIEKWLSSLRKHNVPNTVLSLDIEEHIIDTKTKPFTVLIPQPTISQLNKIYELYVHKNNKTNNKKVLFLYGAVHPREIASMNSVAYFVDTLIDSSINFSKGSASQSDAEMLNILDKWDLRIVLNMNPLGMYIDGATTHKTNKQSNVSMYNIPGFMYRKNGRDVDVLTFTTIQETVTENIGSFMVDPDASMNHRNDGSCYFPNHQHIETVFNKRYNIGVDLNRNCAEKFSDVSNNSSSDILNWNGSNDTLSNRYPGPSCNSEPETQIFMKIFKKVQPDLHITVHGFKDMIVTPDMYVDDEGKKIVIADQYKSIPSRYSISKFLKDIPYYKKINELTGKNGSITKHILGCSDDMQIKNTKIDGIANRRRIEKTMNCCSPFPVGPNSNQINRYSLCSHDTEQAIDIPNIMSPSGIVNGDHTHCAYIMSKKLPGFISYALEIGTQRGSFYPSCTEMINILWKSKNIIYNSIKHFDMIS